MRYRFKASAEQFGSRERLAVALAAKRLGAEIAGRAARPHRVRWAAGLPRPH